MPGFFATMGLFPWEKGVILRVKEASFLREEASSFQPRGKECHRCMSNSGTDGAHGVHREACTQRGTYLGVYTGISHLVYTGIYHLVYTRRCL